MKKIYPVVPSGSPLGSLRIIKDEDPPVYLKENQMGVDDEYNLYSFIEGQWIPAGESAKDRLYFSYISNNIRKCENIFHFVSARQMIDNYKSAATEKEILLLEYELQIFLELKGFELKDLEPIMQTVS